MLVHIVPSIPPAINGLGDYCYKLWEHWPAPRPDWHCLTADVPVDCREFWPEVGISTFERCRAGLVRSLAAVGAETVVLHYVGYGYHRKGAPAWLPLALRQWKTGRPGRRLIVMFHELYATGKPWQTSYWLRPATRKIMRDLAVLADRWVTSCPRYHAQLIAEANADPARGTLTPVGANIVPSGPVDWTRPWPLADGRKLKIVVFGQARTRQWALRAHARLLRRLREQGLVETVLLLGQSCGGGEAPGTQAVIDGIGPTTFWRRRYDLSPGQLSGALPAQDVGIVCNTPDILTKSLVYAGLCAHGVLPIVAGSRGHTEEAPAPYLLNPPNLPEFCVEQLQNLATVRGTQQQIRRANERTLDWTQIGRAWAETTVFEPPACQRTEAV